jgi:hypothetical protein
LANPETVQEAVKMSDVALTLDKVLEDAGLVAKWEARSEARIVELLKSGKSPEEIIKMHSAGQNKT